MNKIYHTKKLYFRSYIPSKIDETDVHTHSRRQVAFLLVINRNNTKSLFLFSYTDFRISSAQHQFVAHCIYLATVNIVSRYLASISSSLWRPSPSSPTFLLKTLLLVIPFLHKTFFHTHIYTPAITLLVQCTKIYHYHF